jgi:hypothetical protein
MVLHVHHGHQQQLRFTMLLVVIQTVILPVKQDIHGMVHSVQDRFLVEMEQLMEENNVMMRIPAMVMDVVRHVNLRRLVRVVLVYLEIQ